MEHPNTRLLREELYAAVRRSGKSYPEIAAALGVHPQTVGDWLRGTSSLRANTLSLIGDEIGVDFLELAYSAMARRVAARAKQPTKGGRDEHGKADHAV